MPRRNPALPTLSRDASDRYWELVTGGSPRLEGLVAALLPGRRLGFELARCNHHEDRAGVVCALTALAAAAGAHVAVGDPVDGDIMLPPLEAWGAAVSGAQAWLEPILRANLARVRSSARSHANHRSARVAGVEGPWRSL